MGGIRGTVRLGPWLVLEVVQPKSEAGLTLLTSLPFWAKELQAITSA